VILFWKRWQFKKKWYSSSKILQVVQRLCWRGILLYRPISICKQWSLVRNLAMINPLIKESLNINKSLHDEGFYTWYTLTLNVFKNLIWMLKIFLMILFRFWWHSNQIHCCHVNLLIFYNLCSLKGLYLIIVLLSGFLRFNTKKQHTFISTHGILWH
jgi:hypothetical protein